jgi:hypothetical protein
MKLYGYKSDHGKLECAEVEVVEKPQTYKVVSGCFPFYCRTTLHKSDIGKQIGNYNLVIYFTEPSRSKAVEAFLSFYEGNLTVAKKRVTELEEIIKILEESEE